MSAADSPPTENGSGSGGPLDRIRAWWGRRSRTGKIGIAVVLVVVIVAAGLTAWLTQPQELDPYHDPVSAETRVQNTVLYSSLRSAGINESLVDVNHERVYVAYSLPGYAYDAGTDRVNESIAIELQRFAVGVAADTAPTVDRLVILQYDGDDPRLLWKIQMDDFDALVAGDLTLQEFEGRIEVVRY